MTGRHALLPRHSATGARNGYFRTTGKNAFEAAKPYDLGGRRLAHMRIAAETPAPQRKMLALHLARALW